MDELLRGAAAHDALALFGQFHLRSCGATQNLACHIVSQTDSGRTNRRELLTSLPDRGGITAPPLQNLFALSRWPTMQLSMPRADSNRTACGALELASVGLLRGARAKEEKSVRGFGADDA